MLLGELQIFESEDKGDKRHLSQMLVPKTLWLKPGAQVNDNEKNVNQLQY
jgi:invasion protein IalB